jgi:DNA-binding MarR family transcriptional regulator
VNPPDHRATVEAVHVIARLARVLERADVDLSLPQFRVLAAIAAGDVRASRLATRLALGKPTVSVSVDALCRAGLVCRADDDGDQRAVRLDVTPAGRAALARAEQQMAAAVDDVLARAADPGAAEVLAGLRPALDALAEDRATALRGAARR